MTVTPRMYFNQFIYFQCVRVLLLWSFFSFLAVEVGETN